MAGEIVGVVGTGTMGAGIAQLALEHGHEVVIHDVDEDAIARGRDRIRDGLARRASKLGLDSETRDEWISTRLGALREAETIAGLAAEVDVAIEAALEDLGLKREIFRALDDASAPEAVLATNTSALSVADIAAVTKRPGRIIGLHFFNPAAVMKLVEVVAPTGADPAAVDRGEALVTSWGKTAVRCTDTPGFIVNRVNRPFTLEALRIVEEGTASIEDIDTAIRDDGFPMGPFEVMDLIGIDVNLATARGLFEGFTGLEGESAERFRPSRIQERLVAEGRLGRKTGTGFYRYRDGERTGPAEEFRRPVNGAARPRAVDRITLAIVAEAYRAVAAGVAARDDVDRALVLGAAHPIGPFARADAIGGPGEVR
ncbi:MAG TPA: 3-hydroxyacyl-CoA dehydrogenase NAD-binding domain-containing protein, partial [Candidatus Limnocylindrales bacterium]